ncbi:Toxin HigB / Protein kinase domain of HipA [hydrothermal vent metagenome]|uniref:Toxin HigB / Protein kinase domain of HipA n=1 Tax=hydrothermal vent metagenome TaxID=652676 RepID=A0A3B0Y1Q8_9ZZZZ
MASLYVFMNGHEVGEYIQRPGGAQEFVYRDSWQNAEYAIPVSLSMPLTEKKHKGELVYNFFDNLLPDNKEIRSRIQKRFATKTDRAFDLLASIGQDCVGAIQLMSEATAVDVKKIECTPVDESAIAESLRNYHSLPLGMSRDEEFRISLAGAQEKTAYLWHGQQWQRPVGTTPTTHIFKQPIGYIEHAGIDLTDSVKNEWLCLEILRAFGLPVAAAEMQMFEDREVLVVERFDRQFSNDNRWIIRHPQEDMCQALGAAAALKYENEGGPGINRIMQLLSSSMAAEKDRRQFMKSVFLFWIMGATDGHAKNFSIFLRNRGRFEMTPVYDVISVYPLIHKRQLELKNITMAMALRGKNNHYKWHEMMGRHWLDEAKRGYFPESEMKNIMEETIRGLDTVIEQVAAKLPAGFPDEISSTIFDGMKKAVIKVRY